MNEAPWRATLDGVVIACRLTPKGGRDAVDGVATLADGSAVLLARVRAAPEDGKANAALRALIAGYVGVPSSRVQVTAGSKSRVKQIAIQGEPAALIARLQASRA
jgi:hypothetical protein